MGTLRSGVFMEREVDYCGLHNDLSVDQFVSFLYIRRRQHGVKSSVLGGGGDAVSQNFVKYLSLK